MASENCFSAEEAKNLLPYCNKVPEYDNTFTLWGLPFDGPEEKMDQEVGYLDNAVDRERKRNAAAARERYHKMTPEERYAKNQKKRHRGVSDDVEIPKEMCQKSAQKVSPKETTKKKECAHEQMITSEPVKRPTRYQRMNFDERKTFNRKKTDAKRARKEQVEREEKKEEEQSGDPFLDNWYFEKLQRSSGVQEEDDENEKPLDGNDAFDEIVAKYN